MNFSQVSSEKNLQTTKKSTKTTYKLSQHAKIYGSPDCPQHSFAYTQKDKQFESDQTETLILVNSYIPNFGLKIVIRFDK